jgi:hypothetical protein
MPYFLQGEIRRPLGMESEYARILAEQGFIGLALWIGFIAWCVARRTAFLNNDWLPARRLIWYWCVVSFVTASLGVGVLTSIPGTFFFLLSIGWTVVEPARESSWLPSSARGSARPLSPAYIN